MDKQKIILFYNSIWGEPPRFPESGVPDGYCLTTDKSFLDDAAAVVFHLPSLPPGLIDGTGRKKKDGQIWVAWYMECESHYPYVTDPHFMSRFDLRMSYRLDSDIVVPYVLNGMGETLRKPVRDKYPGNVVNAFISSRFNKSGRVEYLMRMMSVMDVHSYGDLLRNRAVGNDDGYRFKMDTISRYRFTIAFENAIAPDYVTEKFYDPLVAGSVPVYLGAPNISDFAPGEGCFIDASEWETPESLARYLLELARDDELYAGYFEWKKKPLLPNFRRLLEIQEVDPYIRLCNKVGELISSSVR